MLKRLFDKIFRRKKKSIRETEEILKRKSKNELVKILVAISQKVNKNKGTVPKGYAKDIKKYSKKQIIRAIILLELSRNRDFDALIKKTKHNANLNRSKSNADPKA